MEESALEHNEHREHAEHAAHSGDPFIVRVSVTIAILAVVAASISSLETVESGHALSKLAEAGLTQNKATDSWGYYQAERIKKAVYDAVALQTPDKAAEASKQSEKYETSSRKIQEESRKLEEEVKTAQEESRVHLDRHHRLTLAATLLHVAIAISTISIIAKGQRWPWVVAILLGVAGVGVGATAYLTH
jgi:hypothetical protein